MGVPSSTPPPVGTVGVGELLADASSRTIWLGVSATVDPAQALLVADIMGLQEEDADTLVAAKDYTDAGLATKSDIGHHHAIGDIDGLSDALDEASAALPTGCIVIWSGALADIPAGWHLCDGTFGTPNLRDRMVLGAGGALGGVGTTGGARQATANTDQQGSHTHGGATAGTALSIAQLPAHNHTVGDPGHTHSGTALSAGAHTHLVGASGGGGADTTLVAGTGRSDRMYVWPMTTDGAHAHTLSIANVGTGITVQNAGGGATHAHNISQDGLHMHSVTVNTMPPYIILGYIMRV